MEKYCYLARRHVEVGVQFGSAFGVIWEECFQLKCGFRRLLRLPRAAHGNAGSGAGSTAQAPWDNVTALTAPMAAAGTDMPLGAMEDDTSEQQAAPPAQSQPTVT